ncbi:M24 family metallopeptidase [Candidatus Micrarchaeota archaeon]|nr:M24 family metallopeptidase [Candidatus Micrarchaeota archaeon]
MNIRAKKKPEEISKIKKAVSFTKKIISEIDLDEFKTEEDLRSWLVFQAYKKGGLAFDPIVASGKNSSFPHYKPKAGKMRDFTLIDFGVRCGNYCSDITRVLFSKRNRKVENAYEELQQVFYEILDEFPNFKTGKQVALFSEKLFEKYKLPKPIHSIGHGVGLDIHEFPRLNKKYSDPIKGAVMAIEPAAYFKDFGVRFENTIYFDGKKVQVL